MGAALAYLASRELAGAETLRQLEQLHEAVGRSRERQLLIVDPGFDALRDLDFAFAREQRDLPHLSQIDADGVDRAHVVAEVVARRSRARACRARRHHRDIVVAQDLDDGVDLVGAKLRRRDALLDVLEAQVSLALATLE